MAGKAALVATLGTEPQVVLFAFRLLAQKGVPLQLGLVFHTRSLRPRIQGAVRSLKAAWPRWTNDLPLQLVALPLEDLDSELALRQAYGVLQEAIQRLKTQGVEVHFCVSGGRKPLVWVAFLVAQLLFGPEDRLWYLYSPPEVERTRWTEPRDDPRLRLLELPVPIWTELPLFLDTVRRCRDPWAAAQVQHALVRRGERRRWEEFFRCRLTPAEQEVVRALVLQGGTNRDLARRLGKSPRTVGHQLASVYRKLRAELGPHIPVDRATAASVFAPFLRA
ncbi:MAG: CRISPR-associated ring nuclease [Candidatus Bipolaricaulaceae bacterium]